MRDYPRRFDRLASLNLPLFRGTLSAPAGFRLYYAPGYLAVVSERSAAAFEDGLVSDSGRDPVARDLRLAASQAVAWRAAQRSAPFQPICLTVYLHNECNLTCGYCFSRASTAPRERLSPAAIQAGAALVLENCRARRAPFTLVCHGGGEPSMRRGLLETVLRTVRELTDAAGIPVFRYIATNGVMSVDKARWLAKTFDLVGLSCDGPPSIQDRNRPAVSGAGSSRYVERLARIMRHSGTPFHVRVTLQPDDFQRQPEIAAHICRELGPTEIHVEPTYRIGRAQTQARPNAADATRFVNAYLRAQACAAQWGVAWTTSGSRPGTLHGPYCNVFRDVLNLIPGDVATACFLHSEAGGAYQHNMVIGARRRDRFILDEPAIAQCRHRLSARPEVCADCFNQFHCTYTCPDVCQGGDAPVDAFRCRVQQLLTEARIERGARQLLAQSGDTQTAIGAALLQLDGAGGPIGREKARKQAQRGIANDGSHCR